MCRSCSRKTRYVDILSPVDRMLLIQYVRRNALVNYH